MAAPKRTLPILARGRAIKLWLLRSRRGENGRRPRQPRVAALDNDFIDARGNQFADGIVRCDGDALPRLATDRIGSSRSPTGPVDDVGALATASAPCDVMGRRSPWPMAATRSAQLNSLGDHW
jgi:hypothetical protein